MAAEGAGPGVETDFSVLLPVGSPALLGAVGGGAVVAGLVVSLGVREGSAGGALGVLALDEGLVGAVGVEGGEGGLGGVVREVRRGGAQRGGVEAGAAVGAGAGLREGLAAPPRALALRRARAPRLLH